MERLRRAAVLVMLIEQLRSQGSWCGETHIQKATYFLQGLMNVPLEYEFILYKHGPFSFDLGNEIASMLGDNLVQLKVRPAPYGPTILPGEGGERLKKRYPKTVRKYSRQIEVVSGKLGDKGVAPLERLATALYVTLENPTEKAVESRARRIHELKPHVPLPRAREAIAEVDELAEAARGVAA